MTAEAFETARGTVHAWQCDHMGHANLRVYGEFFEQALWHVFQRAGITPSVLRGDLIFVRSNLVELRERTQSRKPRAFPPEIAARARQLLKGEAHES